MNHRFYSWRNVFSEEDIVRVDFLRRNGSRIAHRHDYFEFVLAINGLGDFFTGASRTKLRRGRLLIIPPGLDHWYGNCRQLGLAFCSIRVEVPENLSFLLGLRPSWLRQVGLARENPEHEPICLDLNDELLRRCVSSLRTMTLDNRGGGKLRLFTRVGGFLLFMGALVHATQKRATGSAAPKEVHPLTLRILALLRSDPARHWTLAELSRLLQGAHPVYLSRVFKRDMETTPLGYLRSFRCRQAARLLTTTDWRINEIGIHLGWDDPNLFARRFRTQIGFAPTAYRQNYGSQTRP